MDRLKSAIADKVLDISSSSDDSVKFKLEQINRFRDFVNACQSLIVKYPEIESELLRMVNNNDFDTRVASSRVDSIIRLADKDSSASDQQLNNSNESKYSSDTVKEANNQDKELEPTNTTNFEAKNQDNNLINTNYSDQSINTNKTEKLLPEDIDYEEVTDNYKDRQYVDFEEVVTDDKPVTKELPMADEKVTTETSAKQINPESAVDKNSPIRSSISVDNEKEKKTTFVKVLQVLGIILLVVALIFIIRFVVYNWKAILYVLGTALVIGGIVWFIIKKNKKQK